VRLDVESRVASRWPSSELTVRAPEVGITIGVIDPDLRRGLHVALDSCGERLRARGVSGVAWEEVEHAVLDAGLLDVDPSTSRSR
jgi:hypothetical protein